MRTWQSDEQRRLRAGPHRRKQMMTEHWQVHMPDVSRQGVAMQVLSAHETLTNRWGYSSGVEHLTADQEVPGSNPGAPYYKFVFTNGDIAHAVLFLLLTPVLDTLHTCTPTEKYTITHKPTTHTDTHTDTHKIGRAHV